MVRKAVFLVLAALLVPAGLIGQAGPPINEAPPVQPLKLSGPRVGITYLSPGVREVVEDVTMESVYPLISQFGWQWERRLFSVDGGLTGVSEWILLVGGLEQSHFLPSLTWVMGVRTAAGHEIGVGPNVTAAGTALAVAAGITLRSGPIFIPVNVAAVPSRSGLRVSLLTGFNMHRGGVR
jgi:hypothetical protein